MATEPPAERLTEPPARLPAAAVADDPVFEAKVIRAFVRRDRLVSIPARDRKKLVILRFLLDVVFPDLEPVREPDVNMRLALWHPDVAALRRYLVDAGLVSRAGMTYRRAVPLTERPGGPPFV